MFQQRLLLSISMLALLLFAGCSGEKPEPAEPAPTVADEGSTELNFAPEKSETDSEEGKDAPAGSRAAKPPEEPAGEPAGPAFTAKVQEKEDIPKRDALPGRWFLRLDQGGANLNMVLLDIADKGDGLKLTAVAQHSQVPEIEIKVSEFKDTSVHFTMEASGNVFDFRGTFADGEVLGNMQIGEGNVLPASMVATAAKSFDGREQPEPTPGSQELAAAYRSGDVDELAKLVTKFPSSALTLFSYTLILSKAKADKRTAEDVQKQIAALRAAAAPWGPRLTASVVFQAAQALTQSQYLPDVAVQLLDEVTEEKSLPEGMKNELQAVRGLTFLLVDDPKRQQQGVEILQEARKKDAFNPMVTYSLADYAQKNKKVDEAMALFAELAVLPSLEDLLEQQLGPDPDRALPSETAAKLWKEKHGNTEGYDEFLNQAYSKGITAFAAQPGEAATGNQIILCELFTGAMCPPCVAADVATGGLEKTYPKSEVIVLRYHEHIPGPDQLANTDTETRFRYYNGRGTPTVCINGEQAPGMGGGLAQSKGAYGILRDVIEPLRANKTAITLKLSAAAKDGQLDISADVTGLEKSDENLRLRLAIVEDEIAFAARNGIRMHEMIVRSMPGGPEGIAPNEGALKHAESINLAEFKQTLADYLTKFEDNSGFKFDVKPLDLHKLHLVAFVQNDDTKEILQVAMAPVTGELVFPEAAEPAEAEEKDEEPADKEEAGEEKVEEADEEKADEKKADDSTKEKKDEEKKDEEPADEEKDK